MAFGLKWVELHRLLMTPLHRCGNMHWHDILALSLGVECHKSPPLDIAVKMLQIFEFFLSMMAMQLRGMAICDE